MRIKIKYQINKRYILKKIERLLQKQIDRYFQFEGLLRSYVELENKLKASEENFTKIDSVNNHRFLDEVFTKHTKGIVPLTKKMFT